MYISFDVARVKAELNKYRAIALNAIVLLFPLQSKFVVYDPPQNV